MKYIKQTNSLLFTGPDDALQKVQQIVVQFDTGSGNVPNSSQFLIYKPKFMRGDQILTAIKDLKENLQSSSLKDPALMRALSSMKWIKNTNSIIFTGDPASLKRVDELLASVDSASSGHSDKNFILYKPQYASRDKTEAYLKQVADHLNRNSDAPLIDSIRSIKWIEPSQSFMFYGSPSSLDRIKELLQSFDTESTSETKGQGFFLYPLKFASEERTKEYLDQVTDNLSKKEGDQMLIATLHSRKWIPQSNSFMFSGPDASLNKIKEMLDSFDTAEAKGPVKPGYVIYKVQNTSGDMIEEDLETLIKNMQATGMKDSPLVKVLQNARYVKETNSILLTGDPNTVKEAEELITKYDTPHKGPSGPGNFFLYKPQHATAVVIEKSLKDIAINLKKSSLADPNLLAAIDSMKYVDSTNSLIFTGNPEAIQKIQVLLKDIDIPPQRHAPIQHVGKSTFLLYKLNHASPNQITTSLKAITNDLKKSGATDKDFVTALSSMKYVKETNSLMFTGSADALTKVQALVEKFDVTGLAPKPTITALTSGPSDFFIYRPMSLSGPELEKTLTEFGENLKASGLNDPGLFHSIETMKYVSNTQSLVFTGDPKSLNRVKELLKEFDIPANLPDGGPHSDTQIQAIDNTSFLVYKLQFHKGDEIQGALRQIAKDLLISNAPVNQNLLNSINSLQWLEVTNSLLCSGDQETLTRLRELLKNLDIPLKQVFIEILVLQTSLTNAVDFGLEWGGKLKYKNKFSGSFNNLLPTDTVSTGSFSSNLQDITATVPPVPTDIPFNSGFDLGVIGDIIMHKGNSFLSLGSLLTAIQTDNETTIVLTPKLITQDSKTSSIFIGQNIPFAGSFISNQSANTVTTSNLEYRDIGFNLTITPVLGNSDIITMEINIDSTSESSSAGRGATFNFQAGQATGITTNRTSMQTTVHIPDKHFLILSGMVNNSNSKQTSGIPCLGGIPVIGAAFTQNNQTESLSSLVIFMRPTIVNSLDDMKKLTADQEDFFREQAGTPFLEHNFDEAMEFIKSPEDE
jgi:type II secretory pathway component GspD/PulD (secretin)